jgi:hypothetical protein
MFDYALKVQLKRVEVEPADDGPAVKRIVKVKVECDLETDIARAIAGDFGLESYKALRELTTTKVEFPIDGITATGTMFGGVGASVDIAEITGIKASATAKKPKAKPASDDGGEEQSGGTGEPAKPTVVMQLQFPYSDEVWIFLGRNGGAWVDLTLNRAQQKLPFPEAESGTDGSGNSEAKSPRPRQSNLFANGLSEEQKSKLREVGRQIGDAAAERLGKVLPMTAPSDDEPSEDERDVNQVADTPEEAEELRAQRLGEDQDAEGQETPPKDNDDEGLAF